MLLGRNVTRWTSALSYGCKDSCQGEMTKGIICPRPLSKGSRRNYHVYGVATRTIGHVPLLSLRMAL